MVKLIRGIFVRVALPAAAGAGLASLVTWAPSLEENGDASGGIPEGHSPKRNSRASGSELPDDFEIIRLAAMAGRTGPARERVMAELAAGASDQELARWLAGILVADPGWLEVFLKSVPEDRGEDLCREVLEQLMGIDERSLWAVLRA